jgi:hypothetical protein
VRWQSAAATPLFARPPASESGAALCFPPQSKNCKNPVALFADKWAAGYLIKTNMRVPLSALPAQAATQ